MQDSIPEMQPLIEFIIDYMPKVIPNWSDKMIKTNYGILSDTTETLLRLQICFGIEDKRYEHLIPILVEHLKEEINMLQNIMKQKRLGYIT